MPQLVPIDSVECEQSRQVPRDLFKKGDQSHQMPLFIFPEPVLPNPPKPNAGFVFHSRKPPPKKEVRSGGIPNSNPFPPLGTLPEQPKAGPNHSGSYLGGDTGTLLAFATPPQPSGKRGFTPSHPPRPQTKAGLATNRHRDFSSSPRFSVWIREVSLMTEEEEALQRVSKKRPGKVFFEAQPCARFDSGGPCLIPKLHQGHQMGVIIRSLLLDSGIITTFLFLGDQSQQMVWLFPLS